MPIHNFDFNAPGPGNLQDMSATPQVPGPGSVIPEPFPGDIPKLITPLINTPDKNAKDDIFYENINVNVAEDVSEILPVGFRTMDRGVKNYFSGIRIPTTDNVRMMNVRVAGGDKTFLVWDQDLSKGRITLPVMSINRTSANYHAEKFSYPHHFMQTRFTDTSGSRIRAIFRPVPYLIDYSLTIWAEHKRDAEYAQYQINTRFNPLAEFVIEDEHLRGTVTMRWNGFTDNSDKEADAETRANVRYDIDITAEGWLPLPEKLLPTILGKVTTLREDTGEFLADISGIPDIPVLLGRS